MRGCSDAEVLAAHRSGSAGLGSHVCIGGIDYSRVPLFITHPPTRSAGRFCRYRRRCRATLAATTPRGARHYPRPSTAPPLDLDRPRRRATPAGACSRAASSRRPAHASRTAVRCASRSQTLSPPPTRTARGAQCRGGPSFPAALRGCTGPSAETATRALDSITIDHGAKPVPQTHRRACVLVCMRVCPRAEQSRHALGRAAPVGRRCGCARRT